MGLQIAFLGCSLLSIDVYDLLHIYGILAYAIGGVTGFGVLAIFSFGGAIDTVEIDQQPTYFILAGIHHISSRVPIILTHLILTLSLGKIISIFLTGNIISIFYNLSATLEELTSEIIWKLEKNT